MKSVRRLMRCMATVEAGTLETTLEAAAFGVVLVLLFDVPGEVHAL